MPRAHCTPLLRVPWPVLEQLLGSDTAATLSLFQSCRFLRDLVLANCSQVQLILDTQHCALGPAAPLSLQLLAKTPVAATIRLILKASVQEEDVCMADGAEAAANTAWLTQLCQHAGGQGRHGVTYLELQGAFMCELLPACIINTFPNLQHLARPDLFITQPGEQFTPTPCPQLRTLTINTAQLPVTNITIPQMQAQLKALCSLQELHLYIDGPPLPYTSEAIIRCRAGEHDSRGHSSKEETTYKGSSQDSQDATCHEDISYAAASSKSIAGDVSCTAGTEPANSHPASSRWESYWGWSSPFEDGDEGSDGDYAFVTAMAKSAMSDSDSDDSRDDRDHSDNCISSTDEEEIQDLRNEGQDSRYYPMDLGFWPEGIKCLEQLSSLQLRELSLMEYLCVNKRQWPCLKHLDLSQACPVSEDYLCLLLRKLPGLTDLQVSTFVISQNFSRKKCGWQHLTVHRDISVRDLAWLPLSGLQTLRAGPLSVNCDCTTVPSLKQANKNLASCAAIYSHACPSILWPEESFAELEYYSGPDEALLLLLQKFRHEHIRIPAQLVYNKPLSTWFDGLPHLQIITIASEYMLPSLKVWNRLFELCEYATRPVTVQFQRQLCDDVDPDWHALLVDQMQEHGHQHVTFRTF